MYQSTATLAVFTKTTSIETPRNLVDHVIRRREQRLRHFDAKHARLSLLRMRHDWRPNRTTDRAKKSGRLIRPPCRPPRAMWRAR